MKSSPILFVIYGITGDLAHKKLLPALFELYCTGYLPKEFRIVGFSHRDMTKGHRDNDDGVRSMTRDVLSVYKKYKKTHINKFVQHIHYEQGDFTVKSDMVELKEHLVRIEERVGSCMNKMHYLAVPPKYYSSLFTNIAATKLSRPCHAGSWSRILVEKPFGRDLKTAKKLDAQLGKLFREDQIFRIDHYLEKEMIQNILTFRFTNSLFEPIWNNKHIERIEVDFKETHDIAARGGFFDGVGALRDVGENHMLQMLALTTMERPSSLRADDIRAKRAQLLKSLKIPTKSSMHSCARGQYIGYKREKGVASGSTTESFFRITAQIQNPKFKGVPIILTAGKALSEMRNEVRVYFKRMPKSLCPDEGVCPLGNVVRFSMRPNQEIGISFVSKIPGLIYELETEELIFDLKKSHEAEIPDAYQKVLYDAMRGDQTLFTSSREIEYSWRFIMPVLRSFEQNMIPLKRYKKGTDAKEI